MATQDSTRVEKELVVLNQLGLHARPAAEFVRMVQTFRCSVSLTTRGKQYDAGRLMELLMANLDQGARFTIVAEGPGAANAVARIEALLMEFHKAEMRGDYS